MHPIIVDLFAGGGGASEGFRLALGRDPDVAVNHNPVALAIHAANHPATVHYIQDVWGVEPLQVTRGRSVGALWASPDCTHFSKAKGAAPTRDAKIRDLAWVVVKWARQVRPGVILLENVEEFTTWGPLDARGRVIGIVKRPRQATLDGRQPEPEVVDLRGSLFRAFVGALRRLGYAVQWRELRACDYGAPTIRKRLFLIARCDGRPIVWPEPTHGPGRALPYRTAVDIIDWTLPCPSIFGRKRPLAENTLRRVATGIKRFVLDAGTPFVVGIDQAGARSAVWPSDAPLSTVVGKAKHAVVCPTLIQTGYGERPGQAPRVPGLDKPLGTVVAGGQKHALVAATLVTNTSGHAPGSVESPVPTITSSGNQALVSAFLAKHYGGVVGQPLGAPIGTVTTVDHHSLVAAHITRQFGNSVGSALDAPVGTTTAGGGGKSGLVAAFLTKYYGSAIGQGLDCPAHTVTGRDRLGLVTVAIEGVPYVMVDIGLRMLSPRELFRAQGFPDSYIIDVTVGGKPITKSAQVRACGNSVCPDVAAALIRANCAHLAVESDAGRRREARA